MNRFTGIVYTIEIPVCTLGLTMSECWAQILTMQHAKQFALHNAKSGQTNVELAKFYKDMAKNPSLQCV